MSSGYDGASRTSRRRLLALLTVPVAGTALAFSSPDALAAGPTAPLDAIRQSEPPFEPLTHESAVARAFEQRALAVSWGDQPFGAVIVRDGALLGDGPSRVVVSVDPTAHAEMEAVRDAARRLGSRDLSGSVIYATARPCRMCDAALSWAGVSRIYVGADGADAGPPGRAGC